MANKSVRSSVVTYAFWRTCSEADAEDLVGEAILCASNPDRKPWYPESRPWPLVREVGVGVEVEVAVAVGVGVGVAVVRRGLRHGERAET